MAVSQELNQPEDYAAQALAIRIAAVEKVQANPGGNLLRAMAHLHQSICVECERLNLPDKFKPLNFTIGSIDPRTFAVTRNGEPDPLEAKYADLAKEMALDPNSAVFEEILAIIREKAVAHWSNEKEPTLTGYDPQAQGTAETRKEYLRELADYDLKDPILENAFLCYGGMDGIIRTTRALIHLCSKNRDKTEAGLLTLIDQAGLSLEPGQILAVLNVIGQNYELKPLIEFGFPVPGFTMAINAAAAEGARRVDLVTEAPTSFFFPENEIGKVLKEHPNMEVVMITPFQNPTALSADPEQLRQFLDTAVENKPSLRFVFDLAYLETVEPNAAKGIMAAISESKAYQNSIFLLSRSKAWGQPRLRSGLIYTPNQEIKEALAFDTMRGFPSFSWLVDLYDRSLAEYFELHPQVMDKYRGLLRLRQQTLLSVLREMNVALTEPIFENLDEIEVPGYEESKKPGRKMQLAQVPLYLFVKLGKGETAWDLVKQQNCISVPGSVFGGTDEWVRFSVGSTSCSDIRNLLEKQKLPAS